MAWTKDMVAQSKSKRKREGPNQYKAGTSNESK